MSLEKKIEKCPFCSDKTEISAPTVSNTANATIRTLPEDERCPHPQCPGFQGSKAMQAEIERVASLRANWKARTAGPASAPPPTEFEAGFLGTVVESAVKSKSSKK